MKSRDMSDKLENMKRIEVNKDLTMEEVYKQAGIKGKDRQKYVVAAVVRGTVMKFARIEWASGFREHPFPAYPTYCVGLAINEQNSKNKFSTIYKSIISKSELSELPETITILSKGTEFVVIGIENCINENTIRTLINYEEETPTNTVTAQEVFDNAIEVAAEAKDALTAAAEQATTDAQTFAAGAKKLGLKLKKAVISTAQQTQNTMDEIGTAVDRKLSALEEKTTPPTTTTTTTTPVKKEEESQTASSTPSSHSQELSEEDIASAIPVENELSSEGNRYSKINLNERLVDAFKRCQDIESGQKYTLGISTRAMFKSTYSSLIEQSQLKYTFKWILKSRKIDSSSSQLRVTAVEFTDLNLEEKDSLDKVIARLIDIGHTQGVELTDKSDEAAMQVEFAVQELTPEELNKLRKIVFSAAYQTHKDTDEKSTICAQLTYLENNKFKAIIETLLNPHTNQGASSPIAREMSSFYTEQQWQLNPTDKSDFQHVAKIELSPGKIQYIAIPTNIMHEYSLAFVMHNLLPGYNPPQNGLQQITVRHLDACINKERIITQAAKSDPVEAEKSLNGVLYRLQVLGKSSLAPKIVQNEMRFQIENAMRYLSPEEKKLLRNTIYTQIRSLKDTDSLKDKYFLAALEKLLNPFCDVKIPYVKKSRIPLVQKVFLENDIHKQEAKLEEGFVPTLTNGEVYIGLNLPSMDLHSLGWIELINFPASSGKEKDKQTKPVEIVIRHRLACTNYEVMEKEKTTNTPPESMNNKILKRLIHIGDVNVSVKEQQEEALYLFNNANQKLAPQEAYFLKEAISQYDNKYENLDYLTAQVTRSTGLFTTTLSKSALDKIIGILNKVIHEYAIFVKLVPSTRDPHLDLDSSSEEEDFVAQDTALEVDNPLANLKPDDVRNLSEIYRTYAQNIKEDEIIAIVSKNGFKTGILMKSDNTQQAFSKSYGTVLYHIPDEYKEFSRFEITKISTCSNAGYIYRVTNGGKTKDSNKGIALETEDSRTVDAVYASFTIPENHCIAAVMDNDAKLGIFLTDNKQESFSKIYFETWNTAYTKHNLFMEWTCFQIVPISQCSNKAEYKEYQRKEAFYQERQEKRDQRNQSKRDQGIQTHLDLVEASLVNRNISLGDMYLLHAVDEPEGHYLAIELDNGQKLAIADTVNEKLLFIEAVESIYRVALQKENFNMPPAIKKFTICALSECLNGKYLDAIPESSGQETANYIIRELKRIGEVQGTPALLRKEQALELFLHLTPTDKHTPDRYSIAQLSFTEALALKEKIVAFAEPKAKSKVLDVAEQGCLSYLRRKTDGAKASFGTFFVSKTDTSSSYAKLIEQLDTRAKVAQLEECDAAASKSVVANSHSQSRTTSTTTTTTTTTTKEETRSTGLNFK